MVRKYTDRDNQKRDDKASRDPVSEITHLYTQRQVLEPVHAAGLCAMRTEASRVVLDTNALVAGCPCLKLK